MDLYADYNKEYNTTVLRKMYNHELGLGEPLHYYNMLVDINGNKLGSLFWVNYDKYIPRVGRKDTNFIGNIYKIENKINGKIYIGQTDNIYIRKAKHVWNLFNNSHSSTCLQMDYYLHGLSNFTFEILENVPYQRKREWKEILLERENFWITEYNAEFPNGYNSPLKGNSRKEYLKRLSRILVVGFPSLDKEQKENILNIWKGCE